MRQTVKVNKGLLKKKLSCTLLLFRPQSSYLLMLAKY